MPKRVYLLAQRRSIAEAVFRLAVARGADAVSMRDVAAEAGVSLGMVQHYFRSKDEMLLFALDHMRDRVAGPAAGPSREPDGCRAARYHPRGTHRAAACRRGQQGRGDHLRRVLLPGGRHPRLRDRPSEWPRDPARHHHRAAVHRPAQRPPRPGLDAGRRPLLVLAYPRPGRTPSWPLHTCARPVTARPPSRPDIHLNGPSKRLLREQSCRNPLPPTPPVAFPPLPMAPRSPGRTDSLTKK